jgi:hypothetical protein
MQWNETKNAFEEKPQRRKNHKDKCIRKTSAIYLEGMVSIILREGMIHYAFCIDRITNNE